jgi:hypothetical protein
MADMNHITWTDNRNGNKDIYTLNMQPHTIDLLVYNVSLKKGFEILPTNNWLSFTVENEGSGIANDIHIEISYECYGEERVTLSQSVDITSLCPGCEVTKEIELFAVSIPDFPLAYISFYGIENITVSVDPDGVTGDTNPENNNATINIEYEDIFPKIVNYPLIMSIIELLANYL